MSSRIELLRNGEIKEILPLPGVYLGAGGYSAKSVVPCFFYAVGL
jgi:hypothetical protein